MQRKPRSLKNAASQGSVRRNSKPIISARYTGVAEVTFIKIDP
jgi:hypothetical protein